jgi:glucose/mannose-6-phosphate isomerase
MQSPDQSGMRYVLAAFCEHLEKANLLGHVHHLSKPSINRVLICGMGGSGIGGDILTRLVDASVPLQCVKDYTLPEGCDEHTLVICSSYSGNTEETVSCYLDARKQGCVRAVLASGGRLQHLAMHDRCVLVMVPAGLQPRAALPYMLIPLMNLLSSYGLIPVPYAQIKSSIRALATMEKEQGSALDRTARHLSKKLIGSVPLVYSSALLYPLAYRWKTQFNENSKIPAFCHALSELDHNELVGFTRTIGHYHVIFLTADEDHERIATRIALTKRLIHKLSKGKVESTIIQLRGHSFLTKILFGVHLGDLVSYNLALWYMTDPTPVTIIEELKHELGHYPPG